jgi:hypothetical protein
MGKQFRFAIGSILKDEVTGFEGVVMGRTEYITGCLQYALCPRKMTKDGKLPEWHWFDEDRLKNTGRKLRLPGTPDVRIEIRTLGKVKPSEPIGGPQPTPPARS